MESASIAAHTATHDEHHGPPPANQSSRVEAQLLGMMLFIISEVMLFGAFFTAYFFVRVVADNGDWFPIDGKELPKVIAGINTAVLVSSSFTMHWALEGARRGNRRAMQVGLLSTLALGITFLSVQINEYVHIGFAPSDFAGLGLLRADRPPRRPRLRRPHAAGVRDHARLPRALLAQGAPRGRSAGHLLALRRCHVDRRVFDGLHPLAPC
jgi:hypothetical protein